MRMDRYEDELKQNDFRQTRTNKNQELYTDVYLNNVYVDINNLKDVVTSQDDLEFESVKLIKDKKVINYTYEDKNYDIKTIIEDAIKNKKDDNVKRNLDTITHEDEITSLIESIEESIASKESEEDLLSDLLPSNDNTAIIAPLEEPILDIKKVEEKTNKKEENSENEEDFLDNSVESDDSFIDDDNSKVKMIFSILAILIVVGIIVGILLYKDII